MGYSVVQWWQRKWGDKQKRTKREKDCIKNRVHDTKLHVCVCVPVHKDIRKIDTLISINLKGYPLKLLFTEKTM